MIGGQSVIYREPKVIAEIGCNHKGEIEIAKELLTLAKEAGAHAWEESAAAPVAIARSQGASDGRAESKGGAKSQTD